MAATTLDESINEEEVIQPVSASLDRAATLPAGTDGTEIRQRGSR